MNDTKLWFVENHIKPAVWSVDNLLTVILSNLECDIFYTEVLQVMFQGSINKKKSQDFNIFVLVAHHLAS